MVTLLGLVLVSAVGAVYAKHYGRKLFIELQGLERERDGMDIEWGQLQLEQGMLTMQGQVEQAARDRLGMVGLSADNMVIVRP